MTVFEIGDEAEVFSTNLSIWEREKYEAHWSASARHLLGGSTVLFCTNISETGAEVWLAVPTLNGGKVYNFEITPVDRLDENLLWIDTAMLSPDFDPGSGPSVWEWSDRS